MIAVPARSTDGPSPVGGEPLIARGLGLHVGAIGGHTAEVVRHG
ncbi:hypothetical protein [Halosimplex sp. J119]